MVPPHNPTPGYYDQIRQDAMAGVRYEMVDCRIEARDNAAGKLLRSRSIQNIINYFYVFHVAKQNGEPHGWVPLWNVPADEIVSETRSGRSRFKAESWF